MHAVETLTVTKAYISRLNSRGENYLHIEVNINNGIRWCGHILRFNKDKNLKILCMNLNKLCPRGSGI
jgi:hypothetical protein